MTSPASNKKLIQKYNICLVNHGDTTSPSSKHIYLLGANLAKLGHSVTVVFPGATGDVDVIDRFFVNRPRLNVVHMKSTLGLKSHYASVLPELSFVTSNRFDIVHIWTAKIPLIPGIGARIFQSSKLVVHVEDVEMDMARRVGPLRMLSIRVSTIIADLFANGYTFLTPALASEAQARLTNNNPLFVMGAGSDFEMFANPPMEYTLPHKLPRDSVLIGLFCTLKARNSYVEIALEMLTLLDDRYFLMITGDGKARKIYEQLAKKLQVEKRVIFTGYIPDYSAIPSAMQQCDILLLPLLDTPSNHLRWPGKLTEYMSSGTPIVTNPIGPVKFLLKDSISAFFTPSISSSDLAETVRRVSESPKVATKIGVAAQKIAKNLDWSRIAKKITLFYDQLMGKTR